MVILYTMEEKSFEVYEAGTSEVVVKKSKFIGEVFSVKSEKEVNEFVAATKKKYYDARHHCFAYCLDNENSIRASDDGEPSGTAGRPILDVILGEKMHHTLVIVTRYFGGTLLGTGGLTRAYKDAAKEAINNTTKINRMLGVNSSVTVGYDLSGKLENLLKDYKVDGIEIEYGEKVSFSFFSSGDKAEGIGKKIVELSSGETQLNIGEQLYYGVVDNRVIRL